MNQTIKKCVLMASLSSMLVAAVSMPAPLPANNLLTAMMNGEQLVGGEIALAGTIIGAGVTGFIAICALYKALRFMTYNKKTETEKYNEARDAFFSLLRAGVIPAAYTTAMYFVWKNMYLQAPLKDKLIMLKHGTMYK